MEERERSPLPRDAFSFAFFLSSLLSLSFLKRARPNRKGGVRSFCGLLSAFSFFFFKNSRELFDALESCRSRFQIFSSTIIKREEEEKKTRYKKKRKKKKEEGREHGSKRHVSLSLSFGGVSPPKKLRSTHRRRARLASVFFFFFFFFSLPSPLAMNATTTIFFFGALFFFCVVFLTRFFIKGGAIVVVYFLKKIEKKMKAKNTTKKPVFGEKYDAEKGRSTLSLSFPPPTRRRRRRRRSLLCLVLSRRRRRHRRRHGDDDDDEKTRVVVLASVLELRVFLRVLSCVGRERAREEEFDQKYEREREEGDGARAVERRGGGRESNTRREREGRDAEVPDGGVSMDDEKRVW